MIKLDKVSKTYQSDKVETLALKNIDLHIRKGEFVCMMGPSGCGKSTLLNLIGLLDRPGSGLVHVDGVAVHAYKDKQVAAMRNTTFGFIFQSFHLINDLRVIDNVELPLLYRRMAGSERRKMAREALERVGLGARMDHYPNQLSGGQQQRVMIAMAIACEPKLLIADEPTTALDVTIQKQIMELIAALQKKHAMSVLFITHDLALVADIAEHVIVMRHGEVREQGPVQQVFAQPADDYTRALLHCRPRLDQRPIRLPVIDDFMQGRAGEGVVLEQRARGYVAGDAPLLVVKNLSKSFFIREGLFGKREFKAVKDVSFTLPRGKTLGVVGESGSGKTTVGLTLLRLHQATSGSALFEGRDLIALPEREYLPYKRRIQIIFQNPYASLNPRFTVGQILLEPMHIHKIGAGERERVAMAMSLLEKVGLPAQAFRRYPHEFSGGQRQRIAIARCLTMKPEILVCDESVSALDVSVQAQVLNLLQDLQDEFGMSYIFISHDLAVVKYMADEVMVMHQGSVVEMAGSDALYANPQHAYTKTLLAAIPGRC